MDLRRSLHRFYHDELVAAGSLKADLPGEIRIGPAEQMLTSLATLQSDREPYNNTTVSDGAAWAAEEIRLRAQFASDSRRTAAWLERTLVRTSPGGDGSPMESTFASIPTARLIEDALTADGDAYTERVIALHARPTRETFELAVALCRSAKPVERGLGAAILGQLGISERPFIEESEEIMHSLFARERASDVLAVAAYAYAHLLPFLREDSAERGLSDCLLLSEHPEPEVRTATTFALDGFVSLGSKKLAAPAAARLISLANDEDTSVRDWAVFFLKDVAAQPDLISPNLIVALRTNADHPETPIRHQAIAGLVFAGVPEAAALVLRELERAADGEAYFIDIILAAERLADPAFLPSLQRILESGHVQSWHGTDLEAAISACQREQP